MKKIIAFIGMCFFSYTFFGQTTEFICLTDEGQNINNKVHSKAASCSHNSEYWSYNSLYVPNINQGVIYLKANFIFLTKPDGTGNFEENNMEHQAFIDLVIQKLNFRFANLINPSNTLCNTETNFLPDTRIQFVVNKVWKVDPAWNYLVVPTPDKSLYPWDSNYYYDYLENDSNIPEGVNVVFANNGNTFQELYVNQNYNNSNYAMHGWAGSEYPTPWDLSKSSKQSYPDVFNKYLVKKYVSQTLGNSIAYAHEVGAANLAHEFGHTLSLGHERSCSEFVMNDRGGSSRTYFKPVNEIGKMHRASSITNIRRFFTDDSYTNSEVKVNSNETWDLDFRLYSDVVVENSAELNLTCNLILPPQSIIKVKENSILRIDGSGLSSANKSTWNGIKIQDSSSLEILPGTLIDNGYFYAYTDSSPSKSAEKSLFVTNTNQEDKLNNDILIYPNPSKDFLNIDLSNFTDLIGSEIKIIDVNGKIIIRNKVLRKITKLNTQMLKKGVYYILFGSKSKVFVKE
jgi:hypothetical protein